MKCWATIKQWIYDRPDMFFYAVIVVLILIAATFRGC